MALADIPKFNDDLLLSESDRALAYQRFPTLTWILDFPELREIFGEHDELANQAKRRRQVAGVSAIGLGILALVGASSVPLLGALPPWCKSIIGVVSALCGILSVLIGTVGIVTARSRHHWMCHRLMTERLRQFHFQFIVTRLPKISDAIGNERLIAAVLEERRGELAAFSIAYNGHESAKLRAILDDSDESECSLLTDSAVGTTAVGPNTDAVIAAYRLLRFDHQIQYANCMLRDDAQVLPSAAAARFKILSRLAMSSIAGMFGLHLWIAFSLIVGHEVGHFLEVLIVWLAITMMAGRAFEEGLQPGREIERYSHYRANLKRLLRLLDQADSAPEKQRLMSEAERIVYQELRGFLLLHEDSKFVL